MMTTAERLKAQRMNTSRLGDLLIGTFFFDPSKDTGIGGRFMVTSTNQEHLPTVHVKSESGEGFHPFDSMRVLIDPDQRGFNKEVIKS